MLHRFCPRCGNQEKEDEPFVGTFCRACYLSHESHFSVPDLSLCTCTQCGRYRLKGFWSKPEELEPFLGGKIRTPHKTESFHADFSEEKNALSAHVHLRLSAHGASIPINSTVRIPLERMTCPDCMRASGGYHEAILQVRGDDPKTVESRANALIRKLQKKTFISKIERQKNGIDVWIGDQRVLYELLAGTRFTASRKLSGERGGKRLYRSTLCVRV
ncbi:MAG TPA: NMD3-related protein [Candidatus Norongarragalinales archaeon]|nr:NMD3-related protein [Candidatus Norongarragalinales archaeon]